MSELISVPVVSKNGLHGRFLTASKLLDNSPSRSVIFDSGREVSIGSEHFHLLKDGSYYLDLSVDPNPKESKAFESTATTPHLNPLPFHAAPAASSFVPVEQNADTGTLVIPRVEEQVTVTRRVVETGRVRVTKSVSEHSVEVDEPSIYEEYTVERVPVNRVVTETEGSRTEGNVMIIPVYEEEVITTKRLILREEIRLTKTRREEHTPQTVVLRRETVDVQRTPAASAASKSTP